MPYMQPGMAQQVRPADWAPCLVSSALPVAECEPLHLHLLQPADKALCSLAAYCTSSCSPTWSHTGNCSAHWQAAVCMARQLCLLAGADVWA